ncbi:MAG: hypothetical protein AB7O26_08785, partial [Planctomycetaceae bacterium]
QAPSAPNGEAVAEASNAADKAPAPATKRSSTEGRWLIVVSNYREGVDFPAMLVDIAKEGEKLTPKLIQSQFLPGNPKLTSSEVKPESLHLVFEVTSENTLDVVGTLADGNIIGTVTYGAMGCDPIRMVPTAADSIADLQPKEMSGREEFAAAAQANDSVAALKEFRTKYPRSPLILPASSRILMLSKKLKMDSKAVDGAMNELVELASQWGPRMAQKARLDGAIILNANKYFVDKALAQFDLVEKEISEETAKAWKPIIDAERAAASTNFAIETLIRDASADDQKKAAATLEEVRAKDGFNHEILYALAKYEEHQGKDDEAIELYSKLAVLPYIESILQQTWEQEESQNPLPSETLARLWKKKHGNTDGLDAHLDKVYREAMTGFGDKPVPPRKDGANRVALVEFFTGAECVPCIAANVAIGRVEQSYKPSEVVAVVYHEHTAGENPLTNEDSESRHAYYYPDPTKRGTPSATVNGKPIEQIGHPLVSYSTTIFQKFQQAINPVLAEKSEIKIKLQAVADKGTVRISAQVDGLKSSAQTIRLRLALAEEEVTYLGSNGIRHHNMVVRAMPGGPNGIGPDEGKISFTRAIKLSDIKQQLGDYLEALEQRIEREFRAKPMEFKKLHLVAFVQDDSTREVLQAASVPVTGDLKVSEKSAGDAAAPSAN